MGSYIFGKAECCDWIRENFPIDSSVLDVGACDSRWRQLLPEYPNMDAVEIWEQNFINLNGYREKYHSDIRNWEYGWYDLIIFGDVLEHMSVEEAQKVLAYAEPRCRDMVIAVPFLYKQGPIAGNPWEEHIQDDLTEENFVERYPGYETLIDTGYGYRYYHKGVRKDS